MKPTNRQHIRGLSLIELMIAMLISMFLLLGLIQVFSASREAYRLSEGLSRVQENARFAMDYLQRDIRMAGHFGCVNDQARLQAPNTLNSQFAAASLNFNVSIRGYDGAPPAADIPALTPTPLAGRDSIVLRFLSGSGIPVTALAGNTISFDAAKWNVLTQDGVANPVLFGLADCTSADVFAATGTGAGSVTAPVAVVLERYGASPEGGPTMLYRAEALVYYIANGASGRPSLYRARINANGTPGVPSEELVEGVEDMQLLYGQDELSASGTPTGYISEQGTASTVGAAAVDWRRVGQVQVGLLVGSPDRASSVQAGAAQTLFGVATAAAADGRYRSTYEMTIALRNRLYGN
jgi:type IV pilus assembly protein PilW